MKRGAKFRELIDVFKKIEGISSKQAEKFAYSLLCMKKEDRIQLGDTIANLGNFIRKCEKCNMWYEEEKCPFCESNERDFDVLMVTNDYNIVENFEKMGSFRGQYFVLRDMASVNSTPSSREEDLHKLLERLRIIKVREIILAFDYNQFGDVNALYVENALKDVNIKITRLARGIPTNTSILSLDLITLEESLINRKQGRKG